jgi:tetratricopeptide (TPR) repeat protein
MGQGKRSSKPMKIRTLLICAQLILVASFNSFAQQQVNTAAEFEALGLAAQRNGKCDEAIKHYAEAIKIDPKSFIAQANSGNCYMKLEQPQLALGFLQTAASLNPNDPLVHYVLGLAYNGTKQPDKAISELEEAIRLNPKLIPAHVVLAEIYGLESKHDEAIRALLAASKLQDDDPMIFLKLGRENLNAGYWKNAIEFLNRSLALKPMIETYTDLGRAYSKLNEPEAAFQAYSEALKLNSESEITNYNLGVGLRELGRHNEAAEAFKRAIEIKKDFREAVFNLALEYSDLSEHAKFLETMKEALRLDPNNLVFIGKYGLALRENGKFIEAIEPLKKVADAHPNEVPDLYLLGNTYLMAQKYDEAIKTLSRVLVLQPDHADAQDRLRVSNARKHLSLKLDQYKSEAIENPKDPSARLNLADAYYALAMYAEAEAEYLKAIELEPTNARSQARLCVNYVEWRKYEKAAPCYQEVLKKEPNHVYYFSLGRVYESLGKPDEAIAAYKQSLEKKPNFTLALYQLAGVYVAKRELRSAIEPLRKLLAEEPNHQHGNYTLGQVYAALNDNTGAMQQYYILQNINPRLAASLLQQISK